MLKIYNRWIGGILRQFTKNYEREKNGKSDL